MKANVDLARLENELDRLASFSETPAPSVTRVLFSDEDLRAREWLKSLMRDAGLQIREDAIGNIFARWAGADESLPAVATGSHTDAIPHAGKFDGTIGVLGGLEAIRVLKAGAFQPQRSIELIMFTAEEPTRFGVGCLGSRAIAGVLTPEHILKLRDGDGRDFETVRSATPYAGDLASVKLNAGHYHAFVELHIEQGPILEQKNIPIGIVTAIAAPATLRMTMRGPGGHAGCVLMPERHDPFLAACEVALEIERAALESGSPDTVATVGMCAIHPGAVNSIPREVKFTIDIRDIRLDTRDGAIGRILKSVDSVSKRRGVESEVERINTDEPAHASPEIVAAIEASCREAGLAHLKLISRAYHDSLFMAKVSPMSMIFVPCRGGISHRPDEFVEPADLENGVKVLAMTLKRLASE